jgi:hypothetical protein
LHVLIHYYSFNASYKTKDRRIKENTLAQFEKNREKNDIKKKQRKEEVKLGNMAKNKTSSKKRKRRI